MQQNKFHLAMLFIMVFSLTSLQAQQTVTTSGGNGSGAGGTVSYSVGQVVYTTNTGANGTVAQGVQQAYEIYFYGIDNNSGIDLSYSVYPNPATDELILKADNYKTLTLYLYDNNSKLLESRKIIGTETKIDMSRFTPATYFLSISDNNKKIKSFKIIKK